MKKLRVLFGALVLVCSAVMVGAQNGGPRGVTPEDYFAFEFIGDPNISPDGKLVAYVITRIDRAQNRRSSSIWMVPIDGSRTPWQFTTSPQTSNSPRWSPDGKSIAFLSSRPESAAPPATGAAAEQPRNQVYLLSMSGGEARRVTNLKNGVSTFRWSPDGTRLVVVSRIGPSDSRTGDPKERSDVRHYKNSNYKFNDSGWFDDRRTHFWMVDVKSGEAKQITEGNDWNDSDPQWSPDGKRIAFVSNRTGKEFDEDRNSDVWVINADGTGKLTKISDHLESDNQPRWSPDGKWIAFTGEIQDRDHPKIYLAPANGGAPSTLAANGLDLIPGGLEWSADGKSIYFETGVKGETHLFRVDVPSKTVSQVTSGPRAVRNVDFNFGTGRMAYLANDFKSPDNLYVADLSGNNERKLTSLNETLWKQLKLADVERFTYKSADNWDIDAFFVKPINWHEGRKYPMILSVHGGPAGQYGVDWYHEFQVYAAKGYAVLFTNPRGSTGYGQKFERGIVGEWGGKDYIDIMNGVDAALKRYPWIDQERMGVTGGSYGGYMTNWIVGHTGRFKAASAGASLSDLADTYYLSEGGEFMVDYFKRPWENAASYVEHSPMTYADNVTTPLLIQHGEADPRVPIAGAWKFYRTLKAMGKTVELEIYPRGGHVLREPMQQREQMRRNLEWFAKWIGTGS